MTHILKHIFHATIHICWLWALYTVKDPDPYKYQVRMWAFSTTIRQWKGSWAFGGWMCPTFLAVVASRAVVTIDLSTVKVPVLRQSRLSCYLSQMDWPLGLFGILSTVTTWWLYPVDNRLSTTALVASGCMTCSSKHSSMLHLQHIHTPHVL